MNMGEMTALVTGANSGIGFAICGELAKRGCSLLMVSNDKDGLKQAAFNLESVYGIKPGVYNIDLAKKGSAKELFEYCLKKKITVSILVNNAGIFFFKDVINTPKKLVKKIINLHNYTPVMLTRLFIRQMIKENRKGYILNMASVSSRMMMPGIALYSATKSFLRCFSRAMRNEVFDKGISITTISPGAVETGLYNLPSRYLKLGKFFGVILTPEKLASQAVKKMFKRKAEYIPGAFINRLFIFIVVILPEKLVRFIKKKLPG